MKNATKQLEATFANDDFKKQLTEMQRRSISLKELLTQPSRLEDGKRHSLILSSGSKRPSIMSADLANLEAPAASAKARSPLSQRANIGEGESKLPVESVGEAAAKQANTMEGIDKVREQVAPPTSSEEKPGEVRTDGENKHATDLPLKEIVPSDTETPKQVVVNANTEASKQVDVGEGAGQQGTSIY